MQYQHAKGPLTRSLAFRFAQQKMESLLAGLGKLRARGGGGGGWGGGGGGGGVGGLPYF